MWELDIRLEGKCFLYSLLLGVILCLFYDLFKAARQGVKKPHISLIVLGDILFFVMSVLPVYCHLLIFTNGQVRFYVLFTILVGFYICRITISKPFLVILGFVFCVFKKIFSYLLKKLKKFFYLLKKTFKKCGRRNKKLLKNG